MKKLNGVLLEKLRKEFNTELGEHVIVDLLNEGENWYSYLLQVSQHGCVSGMVTDLIYYVDTRKFHDDYENEIDELISDALESSGLNFSEIASSIDVWDITQLKNWKSWFAYENTVNNMINFIEELK